MAMEKKIISDQDHRWATDELSLSEMRLSGDQKSALSWLSSTSPALI